jgi:ribose-phosphate pyrophosphokinase
MELTILTGRANVPLARAVAGELGVGIGRCIVRDFPDDELSVEVQETLQGHDVYLVQPTGPPVANHVLELLLISDACKRAGADRVTAVVPYFGYARQDRRVRRGEPVAARLLADLIGRRVDRIVTLELHNGAIEGFFDIPVEHLSAVPLLAEALRPALSGNPILVAPDLGAVKLAQRYAELLDLPVAHVQKVRLDGEKVRSNQVIGDVRGRAPVIVDDMISTGGTMLSAAEALLREGGLPEITLVATHGLFVGEAGKRLASGAIKRILVTDSLLLSGKTPFRVEEVTLKSLLAEAILRLHGEGR